jgi:hypothetical protein
MLYTPLKKASPRWTPLVPITLGPILVTYSCKSPKALVMTCMTSSSGKYVLLKEAGIKVCEAKITLAKSSSHQLVPIAD